MKVEEEYIKNPNYTANSCLEEGDTNTPDTDLHDVGYYESLSGKTEKVEYNYVTSNFSSHQMQSVKPDQLFCEGSQTENRQETESSSGKQLEQPLYQLTESLEEKELSSGINKEEVEMHLYEDIAMVTRPVIELSSSSDEAEEPENTV